MASIEELRHRAWLLSDKSVKYSNIINSVLYKNMKYRPDNIGDFEEEKINNNSIDYIESLVEKAKYNFNLLEEKYKIIAYIREKHNDCNNFFRENNTNI